LTMLSAAPMRDKSDNYRDLHLLKALAISREYFLVEPSIAVKRKTASSSPDKRFRGLEKLRY